MAPLAPPLATPMAVTHEMIIFNNCRSLFLQIVHNWNLSPLLLLLIIPALRACLRRDQGRPGFRAHGLYHVQKQNFCVSLATCFLQLLEFTADMYDESLDALAKPLL